MGEATRLGDVGVWAVEKLDLLASYLGRPGARKGFLTATSKARARYYLDLFAGPGRNRVRQTGQVIDGSPLIALKAGPPSFTRLFLVDSDGDNITSLRAHLLANPERRVHVHHGDANLLIDEILQGLPTRDPIFAFLDPRGHELHWRTIAKIAQHKDPDRPKAELFILFAYNQALVRYLPGDRTKMMYAALLDQVMPNPAGWREIYRRRLDGRIDKHQQRRLMLDEYVRGLKEDLGYAYVPTPRLIRAPNRRALYFLIFATDHTAGAEIMNWCFNNVESTLTQGTLFRYVQQY